MVRSNPELWQRLAEFEVSPEAAVFSFARRLARENRWPLAFARRVFDEYRRFLYLCIVVREPLTPSEAVGQTWQLHLAYPASYGQALCRGVLGQRLCYPSLAGSHDAATQASSYRATLAAYKQEFGRAPPAEIWPHPDRRVGAKPEKPTTAERARRADGKAQKIRSAPFMPVAGSA